MSSFMAWVSGPEREDNRPLGRMEPAIKSILQSYGWWRSNKVAWDLRNTSFKSCSRLVQKTNLRTQQSPELESQVLVDQVLECRLTDSSWKEIAPHLWSSRLGGYVGESHGYPRMTGWFGARYSKKVISSVCLSLKIIVTGEVWWETSHKTDSSKEVPLKQVGNGMDLKSRVLARLEYMKFAPAPESTNTACETGPPEVRKETVIEGREEYLMQCVQLSSILSFTRETRSFTGHDSNRWPERPQYRQSPSRSLRACSSADKWALPICMGSPWEISVLVIDDSVGEATVGLFSRACGLEDWVLKWYS